jgi:hypothetical protein
LLELNAEFDYVIINQPCPQGSGLYNFMTGHSLEIQTTDLYYAIKKGKMSPASFRPGRLFYRTYLGHPARVFGATLKSFFLFHLFWDYFYEFSPTRGASMLPTFEVTGDGVISSKWYRRGRGIAVGDVITFDSVVEPGEKVIKRVIGLQGDYVCMDTPGTGSDAMIQVGCFAGGGLQKRRC